MGKSAKDIKEITNRTHEACIRIIDKQFKAMDNFADRDHCVQVSTVDPFTEIANCRAVHGGHDARFQPPDGQRLR